MRRAIGLAFILLLAPGDSIGQELGVGAIGGYSIPCHVRYADSYSRQKQVGQIAFHRGYTGPVFGGDVFFRIEPADIGLGAFAISSGRISGSRVWSDAPGGNAEPVEFESALRTAYVFIRWRDDTEFSSRTYVGAGVGIYGLMENVSGSFFFERKMGLFFHVLAGIEAEIAEILPGLFAELQLNFADYDLNPEARQTTDATINFAIGLRIAR